VAENNRKGKTQVYTHTHCTSLKCRFGLRQRRPGEMARRRQRGRQSLAWQEGVVVVGGGAVAAVGGGVGG
jgi:hypothetical protein